MRYGLVAVGLVLIACQSGPEPTIGTPTYSALPTFSEGSVTNPSGTTPLSANLILNITQDSGSLSGTSALLGHINAATEIADSGTFTGTEAIGPNPLVHITVTSRPCPAIHEDFSGSYNGVTQVLTLTGPIYIVNADCSINLSYSLTVVLGPPHRPGV